MLQMKSKSFISFALVLFSFFIGLDVEVQIWQATAMSELPLVDTLLLGLIPTLYCGLIFIFILHLYKKVHSSLSPLLLVFFMSLFASSWLIVFLNGWSEQIILSDLGSGGLGHYLNVLAGAVNEEVIKLLVLILLAQAFQRRDLAFYFFAGAMVGLAFQWVEDIQYIFIAADVPAMFSESLTRLSGAFSSHWVYTAIAAYGWYKLGVKEKKVGWIYLASPVLLHTLWNSPLNFTFATAALLSTVTMVLWFYALHDGLSQAEQGREQA